MQRVVFALVAMMFLYAGKSSAQQVKIDYDRRTNFNQYKTYSWEHVKTKDALDVDRIKSAVNVALAAKGWTQVDIVSNPSLLQTRRSPLPFSWSPPFRSSDTTTRN